MLVGQALTSLARNRCIYSRSGHHGGKESGEARARHRAEGTDRARSHGDGDSSEGLHWPLGDRAVVDERCTLAELGKAVHTRDALDIGFPDQVRCLVAEEAEEDVSLARVACTASSLSYHDTRSMCSLYVGGRRFVVRRRVLV